MILRQAKVRNFRLLRQLQFELHPRLNILYGDNGAGKSSILEALYVLARGDSLRGGAAELVTDGESAWRVEGHLDLEDRTPEKRIDVRWVERRLQATIDDVTVRRADLVRTLPMLSMDPTMHRLVEEGPGIRRRYIDWGVFHMEHRFHSVWLRMSFALKQRNAALRARARAADIRPWNQQLAEAAIDITEMRNRHIDALQRAVTPHWQALLGDVRWSLAFSRGWKADVDDYAALLEANYEADLKLGHTREGPHRAELRIMSDNTRLQTRISRGQQKLLVAAMVLAQGDLYREQHGVAPIVLFDDFTAELSKASQASLFDRLTQIPGQKILASLEYEGMFSSHRDHVMFHVEHGRITNHQ